MLAKELMFEWQQCKEEGLDVECYYEICKQIVELAETKNCEEVAEKIWIQLINSPMIEGYLYNEPSTLDEIKAVRPNERLNFTNNLSKQELYNKLAGAWIGRISGCLLGKPVEGFKKERLHRLLKDTNNYPITDYILKSKFSSELIEYLGYDINRCWADTLEGYSPIDDDTNYTVFSLKLIETYGTNFTSNNVLESWLSWIPHNATFTAECVAYRNGCMGLLPPETATYKNPHRELIGAQIRGDFFGYINPANPEMAAEMAWRDASISHTKNGIYGEMFVSAMIATAFVEKDIKIIIKSGLDQIPEKCRLRKDIELILSFYEQKQTSEEVIENIHSIYDESNSHDWCHTNSNAMIVVMALLYSELNFGKSICLAVQAGFDTDCNGATVGSIIGTILGESKIDKCWYSCYNKNLKTSIDGYNMVTVDELVEKTYNLI